MGDFPNDRRIDSTLALLREGYRFMPERFRRFGSDSFRARLMGRRALCIYGEEAAKLIYTPDAFTRRGALPPTTLMSLQDVGSVQTLDGSAHRHRKRMFVSLLTDRDNVRRLGEEVEARWRARLPRWATVGEVVLFPEVTGILTEAVCSWAGSPVAGEAAARRTREFGAMIDGAGAAGPRNWRGLMLRARTESWARDLIEAVRSGGLAAPPGSPLATIAFHRDEAGEMLSRDVAAVEYLNILRPTVAVDRFIVFAALALHEHPSWRTRALAGDAELEAFVEEVRRFYPFFPAIGGRALRPVEWRGRTLPRGAWVLADMYGTNHDPRAWREPQLFDPERFLRGEANAYNFTPQGAGEVATGHRCPGEAITVELMKRAVRLLAGDMAYETPPQDLSIDLGRMPAVPKSRYVMRNVRAAP